MQCFIFSSSSYLVYCIMYNLVLSIAHLSHTHGIGGRFSVSICTNIRTCLNVMWTVISIETRR